jgi:hypothetical protein
MIYFWTIVLGFYLLGVLVSMTALENRPRPSWKDFLRSLGLSLVWPFVLILGLIQAYRAEK